jgi:hypothetical protein
MTQSEDFQEDLRNALTVIVGSTLSCEYELPEPPDGQTLDPSLVNVQLTDDGEVETILQNPDEDCGEGWRYSEDGTQVVLCESTCERVRDNLRGSVKLIFGCETAVVVR